MAAQSEPARVPQPARWNVATRAAFRFCFLYFILYCLTTQVGTGLLPIPALDIPDLATAPPVRATIVWTAVHVFRLPTPSTAPSGSGDKTVDWVLSFCILVVSIFGVALWSILDRRRPNYTTLHKWFYVFLRFAVGSQFLTYGSMKLVPLQMPSPSLVRLVEPYGNFAPMGVLWSSIGAAPAYEMFVGAAELLAGILLFFPRTALLGACIALADAVEIFALNMTYDVPVKLFSFHLILMSLILLAPELSRIARLFLTDRAVPPSTRAPLFRTTRANRIALVVQVAFALLLIGNNAWEARQNWYQYGGGAPKSPLYGIWNIDPVSTGAEGFRRIIFDRPQGASLQRTDDTVVNYGAAIDTKTGNVVLTKQRDQNWKANLKFTRVGADRLLLDGMIDRPVHFQLALVDRNKFLLVNRGFHWIQEFPFNR
jgi:uncharacterized membrane protein YphA (DoxX/SURF4 family)